MVKKRSSKDMVLLLFLLGCVSLSGCGFLYNTNGNSSPGGGDVDPEDEYVTGAWNDGMFWCGDYRVDLECPEAGHPSGSADSDWSTGCELEDGTNVNVDFFSREGSLEDRISEVENEGMVVEEGVLWDNSCYFYENDAELVTIALIEVDEINYVEIAFESWDEEVIPFEEIPDTFTLTIGN